MNFQEIYAGAINSNNNKTNKDYEKYLKIFFDLNKESSKYIKINEDEHYKLINKAKKSNVILIKKSKVINVYNKYNYLDNKISNIYNNISNIINDLNKDISEYTEEFELLKKEYKEYDDEFKNIRILLKLQNDNLISLKTQQVKLKIELIKLYNQRHTNFKLLKPINLDKKKNIIKLYKQNLKLLTDDLYFEKSKEINVSIENLKNWFLWLNSSYLYSLKQIEINKLNKIINLTNSKNDVINKNFKIKKSEIQEKKILKIES